MGDAGRDGAVTDRTPPAASVSGRAKEGAVLELVKQAQAGDREAFEMLVERHAAETYRLATAIVGEADARDLAQEAFVAAWTELPRLRDADAFAPWLRRICVNRCRNWLRSARRHGSPTSLDADERFADTLPDRHRDFRAAVEARALLEPAFQALSPDQRAVLALHYSMGLTIAETADALDVRVGTAKSRLNSGLTALRRAIEPVNGDPEPEVAS
jgi:RNA polymerase sigma-70 factor (ECF subfamily)